MFEIKKIFLRDPAWPKRQQSVNAGAFLTFVSFRHYLRQNSNLKSCLDRRTFYGDRSRTWG